MLSMHHDGVDIPCRYWKRPPFVSSDANGNAVAIMAVRIWTSRCKTRFCGFCRLNVTDRQSEDAEVPKLRADREKRAGTANDL